MKLRTDIKSAFRGQVYGHAGQEVEVIARHGHVLIVEDASGSRFPVHESDLTDEPVEILEKPDPIEIKTSRKQQPKKRAAIINTKQTLF